MAWQWTPYTIPLIVTAAISAMLAVFVWQRRFAPGSTPFVLLMLAVAEWSLGYALQLASVDLPAKTFCAGVKYLGVVVVPVAWFSFALQYTERDQWLTRRNLALLAIEPFVTLLLVWTNNVHGLIWSSIRLDTSGLYSVRVATHGAYFWLHTTYSYVLLLLGTLLLIQALIHSPHLYRGQAVALLIGVLAPWVGNALYVSGLSPFPHLDLTPLAFALTGLAASWTLLRYRLLEIVPLARNAVVEGMSDAMIVLDAQDRIADLNLAAQRTTGRTASEIIGQTAQVLDFWPTLVEHRGDAPEAKAEIVMGESEEQYCFDLRISPLYNRRGCLTGRLIVLRDITQRKRAEKALRRAHEEMETQVQERTAALAKANEALQAEITERRQRTVELSTLLEATRAVSSTLDLEKVLALIAAEMAKAIGADGCTLSRWDQEVDAVVTWIEWRRQDLEGADEPGITYALDDFPATRTVLETRQPLTVRVSDPDADPAEVAHMRKLGSTSLLILPLAVGDRVVGLVELDQSERERDFTSAEIRLCQALADQAAIAIENARLHTETERRLRKQMALREAGAVISSALDLQTVLTRIAEQMGRAVDVTSTYFCSAEPETRKSTVLAEYYSPHACVEEKVTDLGITYVEGDSGFLEALVAGELHVDHVDDPDLPKDDRDHLMQHGAQSVLYIPLYTRGRAIGYAELWESRRRREFTSEDVALCQTIAQNAAVALENARLYERAQQEIAERQRTEEQIKASLQEKEVLLKEIHHRVKNNLQVISSLLYLQSKNIEDKETLEIFQESQNRVRSMALVHERLYQSQDLARIDFAEYVRNLANYLFRSYSTNSNVIQLKINADDVLLGIDTAIPCGLMINELVSNSVKHAFPDGREGEIRLELRADDEGQFTLMVRDSGVGFPEDFQNTESLGLQLVNTLVDQVEGTIELDRSNGTEFRIAFAEPK